MILMLMVLFSCPYSLAFFLRGQGKLSIFGQVCLFQVVILNRFNYSELYEEYERICGTVLSPGQKAGIRKCIEDHSSDSLNYKGKDNCFYSVDGIGNGTWGLR